MTETDLQRLIHDVESILNRELPDNQKDLIRHWAATRFEDFQVPKLFMLSAFLAIEQQGGDTRKELDRILGQLAEDILAALSCVEQLEDKRAEPPVSLAAAAWIAVENDNRKYPK